MSNQLYAPAALPRLKSHYIIAEVSRRGISSLYCIRPPKDVPWIMEMAAL
jgi:hypothetical protein